MATYVLVHGAWHTGAEMAVTAEVMRNAGHLVHTPTLYGNRPGDPKTASLQEAIDSIVSYLDEHDLKEVVLVGHSYGGMVITGVADRAPQRLSRLVYWNAFVPNNGESLNDMVPPSYVELFDQVQADDGSVVLPFPVWRDAFINDGDLALAERTYAILNPHPYRTFTDKIALRTDPAAMTVPKSYINCTEDTALPHTLPWHPRLSSKLGFFRLVQVSGSHELCFSNPQRLGEAIMTAGRA